MPIRFACPSCGDGLIVEDREGGRTARCPGCRALLSVPPCDYYEVLQVSPNAEDEIIQAAYRRLAAKWHPDRNPGNQSANEQMKVVNTAHETLTAPTKRREYDLQRTHFAARVAAKGGQPQPESAAGHRSAPATEPGMNAAEKQHPSPSCPVAHVRQTGADEIGRGATLLIIVMGFIAVVTSSRATQPEAPEARSSTESHSKKPLPNETSLPADQRDRMPEWVASRLPPEDGWTRDERENLANFFRALKGQKDSWKFMDGRCDFDVGWLAYWGGCQGTLEKAKAVRTEVLSKIHPGLPTAFDHAFVRHLQMVEEWGAVQVRDFGSQQRAIASRQRAIAMFHRWQEWWMANRKDFHFPRSIPVHFEDRLDYEWASKWPGVVFPLFIPE